MDIKIDDNKSNEFKGDYIIIVIDSTCIKVTNRGQWMREKWKIRKKGCLKIHIAVNIKSKKILSMIKVTADKHVHDSKMLPEVVEDIIKSNKTVGKLFADGAYDGNDIFKHLADNGILPCIKARKNAQVRLKTGHILRNLSVLAQKKDLQKWNDSESYRKRWIVETVFSAIKRMFDRVCLFC